MCVHDITDMMSEEQVLRMKLTGLARSHRDAEQRTCRMFKKADIASGRNYTRCCRMLRLAMEAKKDAEGILQQIAAVQAELADVQPVQETGARQGCGGVVPQLSFAV